MFAAEKEYYGSATVGERGQIVLPSKLRESFGVVKGDKFLVLSGKKWGAWGIILVKSDLMTKLLSKFFGGDLEEILKSGKAGNKGK